MSNIGKCYRVLTTDEETVAQWPEFVPGFEFQVLRTHAEPGEIDDDGVTRLICLKTNRVFDINYPLKTSASCDNDLLSWFWCLFYIGDSAEVELEEIFPSDLPEIIEDPTSVGKIKLNHFHGREVDIAYALSAFASQENCDGEEYDLMAAAADYIRQLENNQK